MRWDVIHSKDSPSIPSFDSKCAMENCCWSSSSARLYLTYHFDLVLLEEGEKRVWMDGRKEEFVWIWTPIGDCQNATCSPWANHKYLVPRWKKNTGPLSASLYQGVALRGINLTPLPTGLEGPKCNATCQFNHQYNYHPNTTYLLVSEKRFLGDIRNECLPTGVPLRKWCTFYRWIYRRNNFDIIFFRHQPIAQKKYSPFLI